MHRHPIVIALGGALALAGAAQAQSLRISDTDTARIVTVRYADLDLSRADGAHSLIQRVRQAASVACGGAPSLGDLNATDRFRACVSRNMDGAIHSLARPNVTALYETHTRPALLAAR